MVTLRALSAIEVLDSRGRPTLAVTATLADGVQARAGVPSGASTGSHEARELRDHDNDRFNGLGVRQAVNNVNGEIAEALLGRTFANQDELDRVLIALDGTFDKGRLGANAVVGVSIAVARAAARSSGQPLWQTLSLPGSSPRMPVPHFNVINGGVHALNQLDFQEFMVAPLGAPSVHEAVRAGAEIYGALRSLLLAAGLSTGLGDEGGFAPEIGSPEEALQLLVDAIETAGYQLGEHGVALAMDPASSEFCREGSYHVAGEELSSDDMIEHYEEIVERFPLWLLEDGLSESDWSGWQRLNDRLGERIVLVGDDIFCTNPSIIREGISTSRRECLFDQGQPDRHDHRDARGDGNLPSGGLVSIRCLTARVRQTTPLSQILQPEQVAA